MNLYLQEKESIMFSGRSLLMTGASSVLGSHILRALNDTPLSYILHYHTRKPTFHAAANVHFLPGDFNSSASLKQFTENLRQCGTPSYFIHCAGNLSFQSSVKMSGAQFNEVLNVHVNVLRPILKALLPGMVRQQQGHLIFIGSMQAMKGSPFAAHYAASKHALIGLSKSLAVEYGQRGIQCNVILPGYFESPLSSHNPPHAIQALTQQNTVPQKDTLSETAQFIRHLLTMQNVSGQVFNLDGRIMP